MRHTIFLIAAILSAVFLAGCQSPKTEPGNPGAVLYAECYEAARASVQSALTSPNFTGFLAQYRGEKGDQNAIPLLQIASLKNQTRDTNLQMNLVIEELCTALKNSGQVTTMLCPVGDTPQPAAKDTESPRLNMDGAITSNTTTEGGTTEQVYTFNLRITDTQTDRVIWSGSQKFGTRKTRNVVNW